MLGEKMQDKCENCGYIWLDGQLILHEVNGEAQLDPYCPDCYDV